MNKRTGQTWRLRTGIALAGALFAVLAGVPVASAQAGQLTVTAGGPYTGQVGAAVTVTAQASMNGAAVAAQYSWTFGDGGTASGQTSTHTYAAAGTFTVSVMATANGQTASAATSAQISSSQTSQTFAVSAGGPYTGAVGQAITLTAVASNIPAGATVQYAWSFGDGGTGSGQTSTHTYAAAATYNVTVTATASTGAVVSATTTAQVGSTQAFTVSAGGPYSGAVGALITFTAQASLNGTPAAAQYTWSFGDGATLAGQTATHLYMAAGLYTVTVSATGPPAQTATASTTAQVGTTQGLQVSAGGPYTTVPGQAVTFSGAVAGVPTDATVQFQWSFGDGTTAIGQTVSHVYTGMGTANVTLTVTTSAGLTGSAVTTATVGGTANSFIPAGSTTTTTTTTSTATGAMEQVELFASCNNVALTWDTGTAITTVAGAISPSSGLTAIWRFNNATQTFAGFSSIPGAPNDLTTVNRGDPVFICMTNPGSLTRPVI